ncbi:MAG: hypothetical protein JWM33_1920 [Caulobacteraceae bacterium]|nr:hypothetical protein [Caulobacteraceae bacterium]
MKLLPTARPIALIFLTLIMGLAPAAGMAQTAVAAMAAQAASPEVDPNAPNPRMDDDGQEASPPSIDDPGPVGQASSESDQLYDDHVRAAFAAAQNQKGPLEGQWRVVDAQGRTALELELTDARDGAIGGAWFDPNTVDKTAATGLIDDALRQGQGFIVHLLPQGSLDLITLQLQPASNGAWTGTLLRGARNEPVVMDRDPASLSAFAAAAGSVAPYNPAAGRPAAKAPVKKKVVRKAPAKKPAAKAPAKPAAKAPAKAPVKK